MSKANLDRILGVWKLLSFDVKSDNSPDAKIILQPYGPNPLGRLFLAPEGYMSAILTNPDSAKKFEPNATLLNSSDKDVAAAARSFASYSGAFKVYEEEGQLLFSTEVQVTSEPSWYGTVQARRVSFEGERLVLEPVESLPLPGLANSVAVLKWEKIEDVSGKL